MGLFLTKINLTGHFFRSQNEVLSFIPRIDQSTENIHTHPKEGLWKFLGGSLKVKILEAKYEATVNWNFLGVGEIQNKNPSLGEYGYFLELHKVIILRHNYPEQETSEEE